MKIYQFAQIKMSQRRLRSITNWLAVAIAASAVGVKQGLIDTETGTLLTAICTALNCWLSYQETNA